MDRDGSFTAFAGTRQVASGDLRSVVLAIKDRLDRGDEGAVLVFDDGSGAELDFDLRGSTAEVLERLTSHPALAHQAEDAAGAAGRQARPGPGRPRLGVVSREVSLLPRHWEWLGRQRGGASGALRRLVDEARKADRGQERARMAWDAAGRFMWVMGGNLPGFEDAARALHRKDLARMAELIRSWPEDIRAHAARLVAAAGALEEGLSEAGAARCQK